MTTFTSNADIHRYVGGLFETAFDTPLGDKLAETGMVLTLQFADPDTSITLDLPGRRVVFDAADVQPDATLTMSGENANKFWQGKLNLMGALATRKIKVDGNVAALIKIQPSSQFLYEVYTERLRADGRTDLLLD